LIEFKDVYYDYDKDTSVLTNINLKIEQSEIIAIIGENGAGKTTLIRHINGLLKPTKGEIKIFGKNTKKVSVAKMSKDVGIVFQNSNNQIFADTVENEIKFGLDNFIDNDEEKSKKIEEILTRFDLQKYRKHPPMKLSGGEKKRLCLACVLAWEPKIIVLDEPTVGQDHIQKQNLLKLIKILKNEKKIVIIVSHDLEFLWSIQPYTYVMSNGAIIMKENFNKIFRNREIVKKANLITPQIIKFMQEFSGLESKNVTNLEQISKFIIEGTTRK
tara:strand:- start:384 stop:1199 length:816 start_codon:yes stop_codon:yes gene_type:complete